MKIKILFVLSIIVWITAFTHSLFSNHQVNKSLAKLNKNDESAENIEGVELFKAHQLDDLNDLYQDSPAPSSDTFVKPKNQSEVCSEGTNSDKEKDLMQLSELETKLLTENHLKPLEVEMIRAKILALKKVYALNIDPSEKLREEDIMAIKLSSYDLDEYRKLDDIRKDQLISELGGKQYLKAAYLSSEVYGLEVEGPTEEQLNQRDHDDEENSGLMLTREMLSSEREKKKYQ